MEKAKDVDKRLQEVIDNTGLEESRALTIMDKFSGAIALADTWSEKAKTIKVTSDDQVDQMALAKVGRIELKTIRVKVEKSRKAMKEQPLREGQAIDTIARFLKELIEPVEKYLSDQENFVVNKRKAEAEAHRIAVEKRMEEERIAEEKKQSEKEAAEREAMRKENERLRAYAEKTRQETAARDAEIIRLQKEKDDMIYKQKLEADTLRREAEKKEAELKATNEAKEKAQREAQELKQGIATCPNCGNKFKI